MSSFFIQSREWRTKKSNSRERNLQWNKFIRSRENKTAFMKITKKHDTTKIGCGAFSTKIKNEKKKFTFWTPLLFKHIWSFNLVFFLYMGNTVQANLQEWEGTMNSWLIPLMHTQERRNDPAWCKKSLSVYIYSYIFS